MLAYTRGMTWAVLSGQQEAVAFRTDPVFRRSVPPVYASVPEGLLDARTTWSDPAA